ncbi:hypothetical protein COO60DRAFT_1641580 [Scenedesmus sp. NREL 46B-D3]|nr:hypothetical protein COO60DRAFT_1641580 [Scenedesmus sp. NREL 46B-D3]
MAGSTGMLAALPAHSLTHLDLQHVHGPVHGPAVSAAVSAALARLTNLQRLHVALDEASYSCLAGVAQLSRLTWLEFRGTRAKDYEHLRQLLAQPLPLRVLQLFNLAGFPPLDLSRLTHLQELQDRSHVWSYLAVFPPQLQQLELWGVPSIETLSSAMQLQQLQRLTFVADVAEPGQLLRLARLPALTQLSLGYKYWQPAAAAAATWPELPQLFELSVRLSGLGPSRQAWPAILSGVAASTNLTRLELDTHRWFVGDDGEGEGANGSWSTPCAKLAGSTNLRDLSILNGAELLAPGDALALTALTGLTRLVLSGAGAGVGDEAATGVAGSCQQLRHLGLAECNLVSMACLANVALLTQLTGLRLEGNSGLTQQGLMLLTGLKRLQNLSMARSAEVTGEVVERFWAAVRRQ